MNFFPRAHALSTPEKAAYIIAESGETVSYGQLEERANRGAHLFREMGLETGDHIAILIENNRHFMEIAWAAQRCGLYYTPISQHLLTPEVEYIVKDCHAKAVITSHALREIAAPLRSRVSGVRDWLMVDGTVDGFTAYEAAAASLPSTPIADELEGADMLYSSGTTGLPKGIVPPGIGVPFDGSVDARTAGVLQFFKYHPGMMYLSPGPLYHSAPLRFCLSVHRYGGTAVIMEHFDAAESLALIEKHRITHSQWVPTMFIRMLKLPDEVRAAYDVSSMQVAIHGAGPISRETKEQMIDWWGPILYEYYAGTEPVGATLITSEEWLAHRGSVGKSGVGQIHILDNDGNELPPGEVGTIYFSGGGSFDYFNDEAKTRQSRTRQGWSTIGDIGYLDAEGYLYLTDRLADMIISGGVNIYPQESEKVLINHPGVMDVAVFGVPNDDFVEEVKAVVQPRNMADAGPDFERELIAYCRHHLSKIKCPVSIDFRETLPRTPTGKLLKRVLKKEYWDSAER